MLPAWRGPVLAAIACVAVAGMAGATLAQSPQPKPTPPPASAKPKRDTACMTPPELQAEAIVRAGIVLRAYARECARRGIDASILQKWSAFDTANAQTLREAVQARDKGYARNYPDDPYAGQRAIDDTLASRGITTLSVQECVATAAVVDGLKSWNDFLAHVQRTELGMVKTAIMTCRSGGPGSKGAKP